MRFFQGLHPKVKNYIFYHRSGNPYLILECQERNQQIKILTHKIPKYMFVYCENCKKGINVVENKRRNDRKPTYIWGELLILKENNTKEVIPVTIENISKEGAKLIINKRSLRKEWFNEIYKLDFRLDDLVKTYVEAIPEIIHIKEDPFYYKAGVKLNYLKGVDKDIGFYLFGNLDKKVMKIEL